MQPIEGCFHRRKGEPDERIVQVVVGAAPLAAASDPSFVEDDRLVAEGPLRLAAGHEPNRCAGRRAQLTFIREPIAAGDPLARRQPQQLVAQPAVRFEARVDSAGIGRRRRGVAASIAGASNDRDHPSMVAPACLARCRRERPFGQNSALAATAGGDGMKIRELASRTGVPGRSDRDGRRLGHPGRDRPRHADPGRIRRHGCRWSQTSAAARTARPSARTARSTSATTAAFISRPKPTAAFGRSARPRLLRWAHRAGRPEHRPLRAPVRQRRRSCAARARTTSSSMPHGGFYFTDLGKVRETEIDRGGIYYAPLPTAAPHDDRPAGA